AGDSIRDFHVTGVQTCALPILINGTMMRVDLPKPMKTGDTFSFSIKWWYNINDHVPLRDRSGYEYFPKDGNRVYVIAQFYPRMRSEERRVGKECRYRWIVE